MAPELKRRILFDAPGQTCNRFWSYVESVSWAVLNRKKVYVLFWDKSISEYDRLRHNRYVSFPLYCNWLRRLAGEGRYDRLISRVFSKECIQQFFQSDRARKLGFMEGWPTREGDVFFPQVKEKVKPLFLPSDEVMARVNKLIEAKRGCDKTVVGIHIRRGDYQRWKDGEYFYSFNEYANVMGQIERLMDGKVSFYVACNESIPQDSPILSYDVIYNPRSAADDLYALSECDYIIRPPSTFSKWASFMGEKPLHILFDRNEVIDSLDQFSVLVSHTRFDNGTVVW